MKENDPESSVDMLVRAVIKWCNRRLYHQFDERMDDFCGRQNRSLAGIVIDLKEISH